MCARDARVTPSRVALSALRCDWLTQRQRSVTPRSRPPAVLALVFPPPPPSAAAPQVSRATRTLLSLAAALHSTRVDTRPTAGRPHGRTAAAVCRPALLTSPSRLLSSLLSPPRAQPQLHAYASALLSTRLSTPLVSYVLICAQVESNCNVQCAPHATLGSRAYWLSPSPPPRAVPRRAVPLSPSLDACVLTAHSRQSFKARAAAASRRAAPRSSQISFRYTHSLAFASLRAALEPLAAPRRRRESALCTPRRAPRI